MADIIKSRRDTAANWRTANPTLAEGELGFETDTKRYKLGDGKKAWNDLEYFDRDVVQDISDGADDNVLSGKAVKEANDMLNARLQLIASGVKVGLSVSPAVIYKEEATNVTLTGTLERGAPSEMLLLDGASVLKSSASSPITHTIQGLTLTSSSKVYTVKGTVNGVEFDGNATLQARHSIYYGFGTSASSVAVSANRYAASTSAVHTYTKTSNADGQRFYILVPNDITAPSSFSMGGAPFVMESTTETINSVQYRVYVSGNTYNAGTEVSVSVS